MPSEPVAVPAPVANVANASALSAGYKHTCVIVASEVRCWGDDFDAQLGAWKNIEAGVPNFFGFSAVAVDGLPTSASAIAAGGSHTCAIVAGGQVRCWGSNYSHESGATKDAVVLVTAVEGLTSAVAIAAGSGHTCAIVSGGEVRCWGANSFGGLGDGSTVDHAVPVTVAGLANATAIAAGSMHTCALTDCGRVACWGYNVAGQLGNGSTTSSARPVLVPGIVGASAIFAGADQTCVRIGSALECWGSNRNGVLGVSTTAMCGATPCSPTPVVVRP